MIRRAVVLVLVVGMVVSPAARAVVGGSPVADGARDFVAAVVADDSQICTGSVVAARWVMTAAHCVPDGSAEGISVAVGNADWTEGRRIGVDRVRVHPGYSADDDLDVALLHLRRSAGVTPVRLAGSRDDDLEEPGRRATVIGCGNQLPLILLSTRMYEASLTIRSDGCAGDELTICASGFLADACNGDSGGPLLGDKGGRHVQIGIVSRGPITCGVELGLLGDGVYTEVNAVPIRRFIRNVTGV